jgi:hypothetical protein
VTPIGRSDTGSAYLVRRITTKHLVGAAPIILDGHKVSVPDIYADDLQNKLVTLYPQKVLQDDPPQDAPPPRTTQVVFVGNIRTSTNGLTEAYGPIGGLSLIEKVDQTIAETVVERSVNPSRVNISVPLHVVDCLHQVAARVDQVS